MACPSTSVHLEKVGALTWAHQRPRWEMTADADYAQCCPAASHPACASGRSKTSCTVSHFTPRTRAYSFLRWFGSNCPAHRLLLHPPAKADVSTPLGCGVTYEPHPHLAA